MKTYIQELDFKKRKYHYNLFKKRYPKGCFSLQIRYGDYGYGKKKEKIKSVQLRWGIKSYSTQYWDKSIAVIFNVDTLNNEKPQYYVDRINNSFKYTWNYSNLEDLRNKVMKENIPIKCFEIYYKELKSRRLI